MKIIHDETLAVEEISEQYLESLLSVVSGFVLKVGEEYIRTLHFSYDAEFGRWVCTVYYYLTDRR